MPKPGKKSHRDRPGEINDGDVIAALTQDREPRSLRELAKALSLGGHGRRALAQTLRRLLRKGEIREATSGRYILPDGQRHEKQASTTSAKPQPPSSPAAPAKGRSNSIIGRLVAHRDGYGFVVPETPVPGMDGDLFIGRDAIGDAMHGDRVEARIESWSRGRTPGEQRAEGRIVHILDRAHPTVVGIFRYAPAGNYVVPYETRLQHEILIPPGNELTPALRSKLGLKPDEKPAKRIHLPELDGAAVNVELLRFPKPGVAPAGRVTEILGKPGDLGVDVEIIIRQHHIPHHFPDPVEQAARATPQEVRQEDLDGREDFRTLPIVTIDGESAKDFDDAVCVEKLAAHPARYRLQVHIADVAHYVRRDAPLDIEARVRGTSVYFPNRAVPMLPEALSNGICSLNPKVDRLVMSAIMEIDEHGEVTGARLTSGVIRSVERMTYTNVNKVIEGDPEMSERYAALAEQFRLMKELALVLNAKRARRGSIDFDLPERLIEFNERGEMVTITRGERNIAHRLIEEFMLAANETVDRFLAAHAIASLHRVHELPDPKKVLEFEELAHAFGYSLGVEDLVERKVPVRHGKVPAPGRQGRIQRGRERPMAVTLPAAEIKITPAHYQRLTEKIAGKPEERILSYLMLRSLKQARYAAEPLGHFALAVQDYTHFTSPIRRCPDLIVHRILKWALNQPGISADWKPHPAAHGGHKHAKAAAPQGEHSGRGPYHWGELVSMGEESSEAERRAATAERELVDWKTAQFMESHLGEEYDALVISVQKFGFFVELMEVFVEGLVPITAIEEFAGQRVLFRETDRSFITVRRKTLFRLGDRVHVRAERIDPMRRRVEFALVE